MCKQVHVYLVAAVADQLFPMRTSQIAPETSACTCIGGIVELLLFPVAITLRRIRLALVFNSATSDSSDETNFYTAAVVEYVPINASSIKETILTNLYQYEKIITLSKKSFVDIIVFPECGLTGCNYSDRNYVLEEVAEIIPSPDSRVVPCRNKNSYGQVLTTLSCAALRNSMYVAVNLYEKFIEPDNQNDTNFHNKSSDIRLYNTNIVFDRFGRLIARYRKFNLYAERTHLGVNSTKEPEFSIFTTDFGVTFGIIICFDIIFKQPTHGLLHEKNVSAIIFSGAIYSQLPFLVVPSLVSGWAYSMNSILLFSDMPVKNGSFGGSGLFVGKSDPLKLIMEEHYDSKILISKVPKRLSSIPSFKSHQLNEKSNFNDSVFIADEKLSYYTNQSISQNRTRISDDLLMNKFNHTNENYTCTIQAVWTVNSNTSTQSEYKFLSFAGERNFSTASINNYVEACGLTLCHKSINGSCLEPPIFDDAFSTTIMSLDIFAVSTVDAIVIPSTLDNRLYPLSVSHFMFSKSKARTGNQRESIIINMNLVKPVSNLITFGFYKLPQVSNPDPTVWYGKNKTLS